MATIIDLPDGSCIAGDPPEVLDIGQHWCEYCGGDGLDYDWDNNLTICGFCSGSCVQDCEDTACLAHSTLHLVSYEMHSAA